jgi:NAD(P)-dependent dehydrogenase (short-subunit alcohol dehydrogenase family)
MIRSRRKSKTKSKCEIWPNFSNSGFPEYSGFGMDEILRSKCLERRAPHPALSAGNVGKKWGRVIFISSESAEQVPKEMIHYGMTKTAQVAIARGIAEAVPASGVTVNSILVGLSMANY